MRKYRKYLVIIGLILGLSGCDWPTWVAMARCEAPEPYSIDGDGIDWDNNSYHDGGLQFHPTTWVNYGGREYAAYAYEATPAEQMIVAERVLDQEGYGAWPTCSRKIGKR